MSRLEPSAKQIERKRDEHTFTVHVQQRIWVISVAADYDSTSTELLCLPGLLDERTPSPLYQGDPGFAWIRRVGPAYTELRAAQSGIGAMVVREVRVGIVAGDGKSSEGKNIAQKRIVQLGAEGGRPRREGHWRRPVDDRDGAVSGPRPAPEPAAFVSPVNRESAQPINRMRTAFEDKTREGEKSEEMNHDYA